MLKSILALLVLVSLSLAGDLKFDFDSDIGYVPRTLNAAYKFTGEYSWIERKDVFFLTLSPKLDFKFIYGKIDFTAFSCKPNTGISFQPFRSAFANEIGIYHQFGHINISLYWLHQCSHSFVSQGFDDQFKSVDNAPDIFDNSFDKVALRFSYKSSL